MSIQKDHLSNLPWELGLKILGWLSPTMVINCRRISKHFHDLTKDPQLWAPFIIPLAYHPKPVLLASASFPAEMEHIAARNHHMTSLAFSHTITSSPPPFQMPTTIIFEDFSDLLDLKLLPGGQIMITIHRTHVCVWWIPSSLLSFSKEEREGENKVRLIGKTTTKFEEAPVRVSWIERLNEQGRLLQLNVMTLNAVTVFQMPLSGESPSVASLTPMTSIPLQFQVKKLEPVSNNRYLVYHIGEALNVEEEESSPFVVYLIFDCIGLMYRCVQLYGIQEHQYHSGNLVVEGIAETTLVVRHCAPGTTSTVHVWLYPLPTLLPSDGSASNAEQQATTIRASSHCKFDLSDGQRLSWVRVFGNRFIGVLEKKWRIQPDKPGQVIFHLVEICDDLSAAGASHVPRKLLISRGEVYFPLQYALAEFAASQRVQTQFVDVPGQRHLRMLWPNDQNQPVLSTIDLEAVLGQNEEIPTRGGMVHKIRLDKIFWYPSAPSAMDPISGRCVYVHWAHNPKTRMQERVARVFEGLGTVCDNTCQEIQHR